MLNRMKHTLRIQSKRLCTFPVQPQSACQCSTSSTIFQGNLTPPDSSQIRDEMVNRHEISQSQFNDCSWIHVCPTLNQMKMKLHSVFAPRTFRKSRSGAGNNRQTHDPESHLSLSKARRLRSIAKASPQLNRNE
jgi:hypothetical protein